MLVLLGLNHRSAPLDVREKVGFKETEVGEALDRLRAEHGVREAMILSTCNRVELLARVEDDREADAPLRRFLEETRGVTAEDIDRYCYRFDGLDAARHLFQVASGLDSMVLGEPQILGQIKEAYATAVGNGSTGPVLDRLVQQGLAAAKRVRTETGISRHAVSISYAAVNLARKIFGELSGRSVLLLGAGKMSELAARHLVAGGVAGIVVANRTFARAAQLAQDFGGVAVTWEEGLIQFEKVDIVITGTAAPEPVVRREHVQKAMRARRNRPLFLVDIAVPRDVDPAVNDLDNVYLYDIDDLQTVVDSNLEERRHAAEKARELLDGEVASFDRWRQTADVAPVIAALSDHLHHVGKEEIERYRRKMQSFSPEQRELVEEFARSLVQKILHPAIRHLKSAAVQGDAARRAVQYRDIFGMRETSPGDEPTGPRRVLRGGKEG